MKSRYYSLSKCSKRTMVKQSVCVCGEDGKKKERRAKRSKQYKQVKKEISGKTNRGAEATFLTFNFDFQGYIRVIWVRNQVESYVNLG